MMERSDEATEAGEALESNSSFPMTSWTLVANSGGDDTAAFSALSELCNCYWYPLYMYVRRCGHSEEDAQDHVQSFFANLLSKRYFDGANRDHGKLRTYLLGAMQKHLVSKYRHASRLKRGGGEVPLSIDFQNAEGRFVNEPADDRTPEEWFDRRWATTLLDRVLELIRLEYESKGKGDTFKVLGPAVMQGGDKTDHSEAAEKLGITEGNARITLHRMRQRYGEILRSEVASTLVDSDQVQTELAHLLQSFS